MESDTLKETVESENPMKEWLVNYIGDKYTPENGEITVEMIVEAMAEEFPEFVLAVAQENFIRGYQQALYDVDYGPLKGGATNVNEQEPIELT
jgi:hypothetical protein